MTYLHDYVNARAEIRKLSPKLIAAMMPVLDREGCEYQALFEGQPSYTETADSLAVTLPDGVLPEGYRLRIDFVPIARSQWTRPDGTPTKGPGF